MIGRGFGAVARLFGGGHRRFIPHYIERDNRTRVSWLGYASPLSLIGATLRAWRFGARFPPEKFWHWLFSLRSVID